MGKDMQQCFILLPNGCIQVTSFELEVYVFTRPSNIGCIAFYDVGGLKKGDSFIFW